MNRLMRFMVTGLSIGLVVYLTQHAFAEERNVLNSVLLQHRIAAAEAELAEVRAEREALQDRVRRLHPQRGPLDTDLVAERAREVLNFAHPDEIVIRLDDAPARY